MTAPRDKMADDVSGILRVPITVYTLEEDPNGAVTTVVIRILEPASPIAEAQRIILKMLALDAGISLMIFEEHDLLYCFDP